MVSLGSIYFGRRTRIVPPFTTFRAIGLRMENGTQILGAPKDSKISNLCFRGGASFESPWAVLRGGILKLSQLFAPIGIEGKASDGKIFEIPTGHVLMDEGCYLYTLDIVNKHMPFPYKKIEGLGEKKLFLVHASYCHPTELFLPQGTFTNAEYIDKKGAQNLAHMTAQDKMLIILEQELNKRKGERPFNILELMATQPEEIIIQLVEGGQVALKKQ